MQGLKGRCLCSHPGTGSWNLKNISHVPGLQLSRPAPFRGTGLCSDPHAGDAAFSRVCSAGQPCSWGTAFTRLTLISRTKTMPPLRADPVHLNSVTGFFCFTTQKNHPLPLKLLTQTLPHLPIHFAFDSILGIHTKRNWEIYWLPLFSVTNQTNMEARPQKVGGVGGSQTNKPAKWHLLWFAGSQEKSRIYIFGKYINSNGDTIVVAFNDF